MGKKEDLLLSIIIPVYNVELYLVRCLESVLGQTYTNIEVICVNDGSTDKSQEILEHYESIDSRVVVINTPNRGIVSARKTGIKFSSGDYITYVDADDWIEQGMYKCLMKYASGDIDIILSGMYRDYGKFNVEEYDLFSAGEYKKEDIEKCIFSNMISSDYFYSAGINMHLYNKIFKRNIVIDNQLQIPDMIRVGDDAALVYPCMWNANKIVITHEIFYHYCLRNDSCVGTDDKDDYKKIKKVKDYLLERVKQDGVEWCFEGQIEALYLYMLIIKFPQKVIKITKEETIYPFSNLKKGENIILYGSGKIGRNIYAKLNELVHIVMWVDKNATDGAIDVTQFFQSKDLRYDKIVVAVANGDVVKEIVKMLLNQGISQDKICVITP